VLARRAANKAVNDLARTFNKLGDTAKHQFVGESELLFSFVGIYKELQSCPEN
jgi:hypothetical protein